MFGLYLFWRGFLKTWHDQTGKIGKYLSDASDPF